MSARLWERFAGARLRYRIALFLAACALVVDASGMVPSGPLTELEIWDYLQNLAHAPLFGFLALSMLLLAGREAPFRPLIWLIVLLLVGVASYLDEWHQAYVPGRGSDVLDLVTDGFGAVLTLLLVRWLARSPVRLRHGLRLFLPLLLLLLLWNAFAVHAAIVPLPHPG